MNEDLIDAIERGIRRLIAWFNSKPINRLIQVFYFLAVTITGLTLLAIYGVSGWKLIIQSYHW